MASERPSGMVSWTISLTPEVSDGLKALMAATGRTASAEVSHAIERHLRNPPRVVTDDHPDETTKGAIPRPRVGRRKKAEQ